MADELETISAKLPPGQRSKLAEAVDEAVKAKMGKARAALQRRREAAIMGQHDGFTGVVVSTVGGAAAEGVRRKLVGRVAKSTRGQALGLLAAGFAVQKLGDWAQIPYLSGVGNAHCAVAGMVASTEFYGTKDKPDDLALALEATTHKAIHENDKSDADH